MTGTAGKAALALLALLYPLLLGLVLWRLAAAGWRGGVPALEPALRTAAAWALAAIAAVNLATPWLRRARWQEETRQRAPRDPGLRPLLLGLPFVAAPASYGLLLYFLGLPLAVIGLFLAASFLAAAAWAVPALRR